MVKFKAFEINFLKKLAIIILILFYVKVCVRLEQNLFVNAFETKSPNNSHFSIPTCGSLVFAPNMS